MLIFGNAINQSLLVDIFQATRSMAQKLDMIGLYCVVPFVALSNWASFNVARAKAKDAKGTPPDPPASGLKIASQRAVAH